jgi:hypothetical protein
MQFAAASEGPFISAAVPSDVEDARPPAAARRPGSRSSLVRRGTLFAFLAGCIVSGAGLALLGARACGGNQAPAESLPPRGEARPSDR